VVDDLAAVADELADADDQPGVVDPVSVAVRALRQPAEIGDDAVAP
jgi:hypothetical protein